MMIEQATSRQGIVTEEDLKRYIGGMLFLTDMASVMVLSEISRGAPRDAGVVVGCFL